MSDEHATPGPADPAPDDDVVTDVEDDSRPSDGGGPAAGPGDFEPDDPDPENARDNAG